MKKLKQFFEDYGRMRIEDPSKFIFANLFIVILVAFFVYMQLPTESHINYVKKDVLPASGSGFEGVEVAGRKYYCVDFW